MWDLRRIHNRRKSLMIKLHDEKWKFFPEKTREIFQGSDLRGYSPHGAMVTFIHPSAYLIYDLDIPIYEKSLKWSFVASFKAAKANSIVNEQDVYWSRPFDDQDSRINRVRILTCGSAGVGKSTIINKTFGREVTPAQGDAYGVHDVHRECFFEGSQAVIHDSCGFIEGNDDEIQKLEEFLQVRSMHRKLEERLHSIWFCINPSTRERCLLTPADTKFFAILEKYDCHVPVVVILTKADRMHDDEQAQYLSEYSRLFSTLLRRAVEPVFVSKFDSASITNLMHKTVAGLDNARVRALFISAQICDVDFKIDQALIAAFKWFNNLQADGSRYGALSISFKNINMWLTSDPSQNIGQQLCRIVFETFGYSETEAETAASLMWRSFAKDKTTLHGRKEYFSVISSWFTVGFKSEPLLFVIPLAIVLLLSIRSIPRLINSVRFKRMLLIALIDELLIADHIFWISPKSLTAGAFQKGCDQYKVICPGVQHEVEKMLDSIRKDQIFDFNTVGAPIREIINRNRYKPEVERTAPEDLL